MGSTTPTNPKPLRLAILECDTPLPDVVSKYGRYGQIFTTLLNSGLAHLQSSPSSSSPSPNPFTNLQLDISSYDVVSTPTTYPSLSSIDAILLTGSKHTAFDNDPWILSLVDFTRRVLTTQSRVRVVGICFGHQIIARALGAPVTRSDKGWEVAVLPIDLTPAAASLFRDLETGEPLQRLRLHQMHRDIVAEYPSTEKLAPSTSTSTSSSTSEEDKNSSKLEIQPLGSTPKCSTQGMYVPGRLLTVQGHPEFNAEIVSTILDVRHGMGVFDDAVWEDGKERVGSKHDGVVVGAAVVRFLAEGLEGES